MRTLSLKERDIIKEETENQKAFKAMYDEIAAKNHLVTAIPDGSDLRKQITGLIKEIED